MKPVTVNLGSWCYVPKYDLRGILMGARNDPGGVVTVILDLVQDSCFVEFDCRDVMFAENEETLSD